MFLQYMTTKTFVPVTKKKRILAQNNQNWLKIGIFGSFDALLVGGCGAWAVSRKTPIYVMFSLTFTIHTY